MEVKMIDWDLIDDDVVAIVRHDADFTGLVFRGDELVYEFSECRFYGEYVCIAVRPDAMLKVLNSYQGHVNTYKKAYEMERKARKELAIKLNAKESNDK